MKFKKAWLSQNYYFPMMEIVSMFKEIAESDSESEIDRSEYEKEPESSQCTWLTDILCCNIDRFDCNSCECESFGCFDNDEKMCSCGSFTLFLFLVFFFFPIGVIVFFSGLLEGKQKLKAAGFWGFVVGLSILLIANN